MAKAFAVNETEAYMAALAAYELEAAARKAARKAAAKANPAPKRTNRPLYGDFALMAAFNGITTDGTGRKASRVSA